MNNIINIEEKFLAKMSPEIAAGRLMAIPASERLDILLNRSDAQAVVHALPEQDFYLFVKEVGEENAISILAFANNSQINHILDLEGWNRDQVQAGKTLAWLESILKANDQIFLEWLYKVDFELLVTLFKKWLDVQLLPEDTEISELPNDFPQDTIDGQYYFDVKYPQYTDCIKSVLNFLFDTHNEFYRELFNHVMFSLETELEELAYRFHRGRLDDNAIPDFQEAASIYHLLNPSNICLQKTNKADQHQESGAAIFAMMLVPKHDLLTEALALIDDTNIIKTLQTEFASLANKIIIADDLAPDIPENLRQAADKAAAYVNLALEEESSNEIAYASNLLSTTFLEDLFRIGQTKIKSVYNQLNEIVQTGWISRWPHGFNCLDQYWQEQASLIMADTPMIMRRQKAKNHRREDLIRTRADLNQAKTFVTQIADLAPIYADLEHTMSQTIGQSWDDLDFSLWRKGQLNYLESVTLGTLLLTATAQKVWTKMWLPAPIPLSKWPEIFPLLEFDTMRDTFSKYLADTLTNDSAIKTTADYMEQILKNYQEEMVLSNDGSSVNPKLVPFFMFTEK